ncbi:MAG: M23 family metallopeptidase [Deltaproteobacteria bacterium]|nr:M23 family metallopeptidase [Deltaproteobacteria bacterium]
MNDPIDSYNNEPEPRPRLIRLKHFIILVVICLIVPIAGAGWTDLYRNFLERNPPVITAKEGLRGVGSFPVSIRFEVTDSGAGLDEIVVRMRQKTSVNELKRISPRGKKQEEVLIEFDGEKSGLSEGTAFLEIRAFDRSFWSTPSEASMPIQVDFRKPRVEVLSTQHNARHGGAQLVFYKAYDENLAVSGIKVGSKAFLGFPASGLDKALSDQSLFAAVYAVGLDDSATLPVKVFAEDKVGNAISGTFYNKVAGRTQREITLEISEQFLREKIVGMAEQYRSKRQSGESSAPRDAENRQDNLLEDFKTANEKLRALNEAEITSVLSKNLRNDAYWKEPFFRQMSKSILSFSDVVTFKYNGESIGKYVNRGEDLVVTDERREVLATNDGIVVLAEEVGVLGWTVAIDHGLGVASLYSSLERPLVRRGIEVSRGQPIGIMGSSGFARQPHVHFEIRVQGVPVDPREWWEANWFYAHIIGKLNDLKKALGIPVYMPLG